MKLARIIIIYIIIMITIIIPNYSYAGIVLNVISVGEDHPYRILRGIEDNEYWIVSFTQGIMLLEETHDNVWEISRYNIGTVIDATGPDQSGNIYCCCAGGYSYSKIIVFNCITKTVEEEIFIGEDNILLSLTISPDNSVLYVLGMDWPRIGERNDGYLDANEHPLSGRIWMIDTATYEVNPEVIEVGAHPYTLYYAEDPLVDKLFVCTQESQLLISMALRAGWYDVVEIMEGYPIRQRFLAGFNYGAPFLNDMVTWSTDDNQMAICNFETETPDIVPDYPEYSNGIWIIDTITNEVIRRITVTGSNGTPCGVGHMCISSVNPGIAYLGPGIGGLAYEILVLDMECGEVVDIIDLGDTFIQEKFIYEIPDGRLIVTGGISSNIVIIDPT